MRHLFLTMIVALAALVLGASKPIDGALDIEAQEEFTPEEVQQAIMALHTSKDGKALIWYECGKRLGKEQQEERAAEYRDAIMSSIEDVHTRTGFRIDPRIPAAILFRESSNDECIIGKQETDRLAEQLGRQPTKKELLGHVRKWATAKTEAQRWCTEKKQGGDCFSKYMKKHYPQYVGIRGWDLGGAQYRWPSVSLRRRMVTLPSGEVAKATVENLFRYDVSIQLMVEDLEVHFSRCKEHSHWMQGRWGKRIRKLATEEAYYVHHHTSSYSWSHRYWKQIGRHLKVIDSVKSLAVARLDKLQLIMGRTRFF